MTLIEFIMMLIELFKMLLFTIFNFCAFCFDFFIPDASIECKAILTMIIMIAPVLGTLYKFLTRKQARLR